MSDPFKERVRAARIPRTTLNPFTASLAPIGKEASMFGISFKSQSGGATLPTSPDRTVVDVRTPEEFAQAHVQGARNIPVQQLAQRYTELGSDKDVPIVLYCRSGARSAVAAKLLRDHGFTHVTDIGAMGNWNAYRARAR
jgi:phage shock protein E